MRCHITAVMYSLLPTHTESYKLHTSTITEAPQSFKPTQWQCLVFKLNHQLMQPESCLSCSTVWPADNLSLSDCSRAARKELLGAAANATTASSDGLTVWLWKVCLRMRGAAIVQSAEGQMRFSVQPVLNPSREVSTGEGC